MLHDTRTPHFYAAAHSHVSIVASASYNHFRSTTKKVANDYRWIFKVNIRAMFANVDVLISLR